MASIHTGGCHCGAVKIRVEGDSTFDFFCHCSDCRRLNGGGRLAAASFKVDEVTFAGDAKEYIYPGGSGEPIHMTFCGTCATPLTAEPKKYPGAMVVRVSALDDSSFFEPRKSLHGGSAHAWDAVI